VTAVLREATDPERRRRFNPSDLTLDELEEAEDRIGLPMSQWEAAPSQTKVIRAMGLIIMRRDRPDLTWEEMGGMTMGELEALIDLWGFDEPDPSERASE